MKTLWSKGNFRITEHRDLDFDLEDLKGDTYNPKVNPDIDPNTLENEEKIFESEVQNVGVFGYVLEVWNPEVGNGWTHVDSCYGFVGMYDSTNEKYNHYIVEELIATAERSGK